MVDRLTLFALLVLLPDAASADPPQQAVTAPAPPLPSAPEITQAAPGPAAVPRRWAQPPASHAADYQLRPEASGVYVYEDMRFTAQVAPDGSVSFKDRRGTVGWFIDFLSTPVELARRTGYSGRVGLGAPPNPISTLPPTRPDPNVHEPGNLKRFGGVAAPMIGMRGTYDLTGEYLRSLGDDPYRYEKAKFLASTREFRTQLGAAHRKEILGAALADLPRRLDELWRDARYTPRERHDILLLLRAETDETEGGAKARAAIDTFLAGHSEPH